MTTDVSTPDDGTIERADERSEQVEGSERRSQFESIVAYNAGSRVVLCDRRNAAAWIAADSEMARSRDAMR